MVTYCLDTYALWEIQFENLKYAFLLNQSFVITDWTLVEFYKTMIREFNRDIAVNWCNKFKPHAKKVEIDLLIKAVDLQSENKKDNMSLFDCVGYIFSLQNDFTFVTGDRVFKNKKGVLFIPK